MEAVESIPTCRRAVLDCREDDFNEISRTYSSLLDLEICILANTKNPIAHPTNTMKTTPLSCPSYNSTRVGRRNVAEHLQRVDAHD